MLLTYLPPEIIRHIFLKLPIKTLLILKRVNKFCLRLISSADFVKAHLKISSEDVNFSGYRIIVPDGTSCSLKQLSFESLLSNSLTDFVILDYPKKDLLSPYTSLVGSCNGLVCIVKDHKYVVVWNPCIGKYRKFPNANGKMEACINFAYGFGYDESNDDYKVVCVFDSYENESWHQNLVKVYSLKRNSWKRLEDYKGDVLDSDTGKTASGKLHWFTYPLEGNSKKDIVSFDIENELFGIVEQPNYGSGGPFNSTLGVLGGCLCVLCYDEKKKYADLWVMKEHGVKESWTKMVTFSCKGMLEKTNCLRPWSMLPNGEILLDNTESFVILNPKDYYFQLPMIRKWDYLYEPIIYVESLVSPVVCGRRRR